MSVFEQGRGVKAAEPIHNLGIEQEKNINEPTARTSADYSVHDINLGEKTENGESDIQPAKAPQSVPQSKSAEIEIGGDREAPELDRARIERMGRERPTKFKSLGAELTFCYSVIASQFMIVSSVAATPLKRERALTRNRNILSLVSTSYYQP